MGSGELGDHVALVTGASRGIGRGIAQELGAAGATVYVTGRTVHAHDNPVGGTVAATADEVTAAGGFGVAVRCDHTDDDQVEQLFDQIRRDHGRLDILVNNASSAQKFAEWMVQPVWEQGAQAWRDVIDAGLRIHYMATVFGTRLMIESGRGLVVNISSSGATTYHNSVVYGIGKAGTDKMTADSAKELTSQNVAVVSLWPGMVATESVDLLESQMGIDLSAVRDEMETPRFTGRAVVALATDPDIMARSGKAWIVADLAREYGFTDVDGTTPPTIATDIERIAGRIGLSQLDY
jgi:NAD(P)-dependent dehydrogenase (short-subunit alcohol dehydrogenase family)